MKPWTSQELNYLLGRHFGDLRSCQKGRCEKEGPSFSHAAVKKVIPRPGESDTAYAKKPGIFVNVDELKNVECSRCHKKGHYANKCPVSDKADEQLKAIRPIRIRFLDLSAEDHCGD